jgi:hypothetical protein
VPRRAEAGACIARPGLPPRARLTMPLQGMSSYPASICARSIATGLLF